MVTIAVIIPCHNHAPYLQFAVGNALDADEVIIVDDHSTDDSAQAAAALIAQYGTRTRLTYLDNPGTGVVAARNTGITAATSELILPCDADDFLMTAWRRAYERAWEPGTWVYSDYYLTSGGATERKQAPPPGVLHRKNVTHATILFAKADWARVGGYDADFEICCEDWAFTIALTEAGIKPKYIYDATYIKREGGKGGRSRACLRHAKRVRQLLASKYGSRYA